MKELIKAKELYDEIMWYGEEVENLKKQLDLISKENYSVSKF